jgi:putative spermidine/putrescine transport system ATP-binding protein
MIAGFVQPDSGEVSVAGRAITALPPQRRNMGLVLQRHALFPHLSIFENVAYGLRRRHRSKSEITDRVMRALSTVGLGSRATDNPRNLSGGQRQRVALARAMVIEPDILLLDEPLSSLDAHLRVQMREEIRSLVTRTSLTTLFVTHDQEEAISIADRIVVMNAGRALQVGSPRELYDRPVNRFVANFMGRSFSLQGVVTVVSGDSVTVELPNGLRVVGYSRFGAVSVGEKAVVTVRHEAVALSAVADARLTAYNVLSLTLESHVFLGEVSRLTFADLKDVALIARESEPLSVGSSYSLNWRIEDCHVFALAEDEESEYRPPED